MAELTDGNAPLWRDCVGWLVRLKILRSDQFPPSAELIHFGQCIRDGFILCYLITKLDTTALDFREVCQRTQMSQYMSLKNIRLFLRACRKFDLADSDLFEPAMLFDYTNFGQVIRTLSKLSKCPKVAHLGIQGFPAIDIQHSSEDDDIYRRLEFDEQEEEPYHEHCYEAADESIYEDLCSVGRNRSSQPSTFASTPVDRRDYSIRELVETEKNYVDALGMIKTRFIRPLTTVLSEEEKNYIFFGIEKLHEIHSGFYNDLMKSYTSASGPKLYTVFLTWKERFLIYGDFCANIDNAHRVIETAISRSKTVVEEIERCQKDASRGAFHYLSLKDLITLPMQRILKYPLLLKTLCSHTDRAHEDYQGLCLAEEAMVDLAEFINEAKRDYEMRQIISAVQASIADWNTLENRSLVECGRLIKDGELKMRSHEESRSPKTRYVFVFNRGVVFCKTTRGDQYMFKLFLPLENYKLEDHTTNRNREGHQWLLVDKQNKTAYTLYAKSFEDKNKWIRAFKEAFENLNPSECWGSEHVFKQSTFTSSVKNCDVCKKLFKGTFLQGYKCSKCDLVAHKRCLSVARDCGVPQPPPRPRPALPPRPSSPPLNQRELERYPWYAGEMNREAAESVLRGSPLGTYLIRFKSEDRVFAVSLKTGDEIKHMKVKCQDCDNGNKRYFLSDAFTFRSVVELVQRYTEYNLSESFMGLDAFLRIPWKQVFHTAKVIEDYNPDMASPNLLTILRGQHIIVVSKEGDSTGWWKGRYNDEEGYFPRAYVIEENFAALSELLLDNP